MANLLYTLLAGLIGYLLGAIPFGFLYVRLVRGVDLTKMGSGRTGGSNSMRAAGLQVGLFTGFSDVLKGAGSIWIATALFGEQIDPAWLPWLKVVAGAMSVVGHNWSIYIGFKGGAGTGPNVGWAMALWWPMLPIAVGVMAFIFLVVGMASIASLSMAAIIPLVFGILYFANAEVPVEPAYIIGGVITGLIVTWSLRPNIKRLLEGSERVVGPRARKKNGGSPPPA